MIVWILCSAFLLLGFAIGIYINTFHRKKKGVLVDPALTFEEAHEKAVKEVK